MKEQYKEVKLFPYKDLFPKVNEDVFLASGAKLIGDVQIEEGGSVWYNTVIRGDVNFVRIGKNSNVQDNSMLHVTNEKYPLNIGNRVTIGHSVTLHGCTIEDLCLIGMGATILDNATVETKSIVAAGSLVKQGFTVPSGKLVAGVPAKVIRDLTEDELAELERSADRYVKYKKETVESLKKHGYQVDW